jgi:alpha-beta hydrolase superfamily lysophospholipase
MDAAQAAAPGFTAPALFLYGARDEIVPAEATKATWEALPSGRVGLYPNGWHLLLRDLGRAAPIGDTIAWINDRTAPLPSGAEANARNWLAEAS